MRFIGRVLLPFLLLSYVATETYLKLQNSSLCGEVGCKLAGELLNFDPLYLNYFGMVGLVFLTLFGLLSFKNSRFEALFFITLYGAIAFEATLIGYQLVVNTEPCIFCLGVFSSLLFIALVSHFKHFLITLATIGGIYVALNTLALTKNQSFVTQDGNYLIQSGKCPHCIKVKDYLSKNNINYTPISTKEASARNFLKFTGIKSIPVLVIKEKSNTTLITGDQKIIAHFQAETMPDVKEESITEAPIQSSSLDLSGGGLSSDFLSAGGDDDGCAITIVETPSCEENKTTH